MKLFAKPMQVHKRLRANFDVPAVLIAQYFLVSKQNVPVDRSLPHEYHSIHISQMTFLRF